MNTSIIYTESLMNFGGQEAQALLQMKGLIHRGLNVTLACHIAHEAKKTTFLSIMFHLLIVLILRQSYVYADYYASSKQF